MNKYAIGNNICEHLRRNHMSQRQLAERLNNTEVTVSRWCTDLVPVVRCKDCKFRENDDFCTGRGFPYQLVPDDGFCDKGEREE